ncbi:MAG: hypothetical protein HZB30_05745 [Nitrospirae bacterium]|nr:hypothetical protein [Nitrospirota bacterium]
MMTKKIILFLVISLGIISLVVSTGNSHNNSAPNFECIGCHQGEGSAEIKIDGLPEKYIPGKTYKITLTIVSDNQSLGDVAGGFAIEASAGDLMVTDRKNTQLSEGFLTHTKEGSAFRKWTFGWKAPVQKTEANLTVMAVAANGDYSPAGDVTGAGGFLIMPEK